MSQTETIGEITKAIAAVTGTVGPVAKTGENNHDRYKYASDYDLTRAVGPALAAQGLAIAPVAIDSSAYEAQTAKGNTERGVVMVVTWRVVHSSGEWLDIVTVGEGRDRGDKGSYKAMTGARKYALRLLFSLATTDDAEEAGPAAPPRPVDTSRDKIVASLKALDVGRSEGVAWMRIADALDDASRHRVAKRIGDGADPRDVLYREDDALESVSPYAYLRKRIEDPRCLLGAPAPVLASAASDARNGNDPMAAIEKEIGA